MFQCLGEGLFFCIFMPCKTILTHEFMDDQQKKVNIALSPEVAEGTYSNMALIAHSPSEFIFDFIRAMPGQPQPAVKSRVIMTPDNAKKFLLAFQENIANYEAKFGAIEAKRPDPLTIPFGLGPQGEA